MNNKCTNYWRKIVFLSVSFYSLYDYKKIPDNNAFISTINENMFIYKSIFNILGFFFFATSVQISLRVLKK